jgi:hypothetical protein
MYYVMHFPTSYIPIMKTVREAKARSRVVLCICMHVFHKSSGFVLSVARLLSD